MPWLTRRTGQGRLERSDQRSKMPNALGGWCRGCKLGFGFGFDAAVNRADWPLRTSSPKKRLTTERFLRHGACIAAVMGWAPAPLHRSVDTAAAIHLFSPGQRQLFPCRRCDRCAQAPIDSPPEAANHENADRLLSKKTRQSARQHVLWHRNQQRCSRHCTVGATRCRLPG